MGRLRPGLLIAVLAGMLGLHDAVAQPEGESPERGDAQALPGERAPADAPADAPAPPQLESGRGWGLAPIRWGGAVELELRSTQTSDSRYTQTLEHPMLRGATYVWQPWFAQLSGSLGLILSQSSSDRGSGLPGATDGTSHGSTVDGSLALSLFPQSRFPFMASYWRTDSRTSDAISSVDTISDRLTLRQDYRNPVGDTRYSLNLDHSQLSNQVFGRDRVDLLTGTMNRTRDNQSLSLYGTHSRNSRSRDDVSTAFTNLSVVHDYRLDDELSVNTFASANRSDIPVNVGGRRVDSRRTFHQISSFANWYPFTERPLTVNAGIRLAQAGTGAGDAGGGASRLFNANGAATYRATDNLHLSGSASLQHTRIGPETVNLTTQSMGVGYAIDPRRWGEYIYTAATNAYLTNVSGLRDGNRLSLGANFNHGVTRDFALAPSLALGASVGQTLAAARDGSESESETIGHNAGLTLRYTPEGSVAGYASASVADARTSGNFESRFQLVNVQLSGQLRFSRYANASGNLTWQSYNQDSEQFSSRDSGRRSQASGGATFQHVRLFGVPRLRYQFTFSVYDTLLNSRLAGNPDAFAESVTWTTEQRLDYLVGRLGLRIGLRLAEIDGKKNALLYLRVSRQFGEY